MWLTNLFRRQQIFFHKLFVALFLYQFCFITLAVVVLKIKVQFTFTLSEIEKPLSASSSSESIISKAGSMIGFVQFLPNQQFVLLRIVNLNSKKWRRKFFTWVQMSSTTSEKNNFPRYQIQPGKHFVKNRLLKPSPSFEESVAKVI